MGDECRTTLVVTILPSHSSSNMRDKQAGPSTSHSSQQDKHHQSSNDSISEDANLDRIPTLHRLAVAPQKLDELEAAITGNSQQIANNQQLTTRGNTPLHSASWEGNWPAVGCLLHYGYSGSTRNAAGVLPCHMQYAALISASLTPTGSDKDEVELPLFCIIC